MNLIAMIIALGGVILNVKRKWQGFLLCLVSNGWWFWHNITIGEYCQAVLFAVFWLLSLYGIYKWRHRSQKARLLYEEMRIFCKRILKTKEELISNETGRVSIGWIYKVALRILTLIEAENQT